MKERNRAPIPRYINSDRPTKALSDTRKRPQRKKYMKLILNMFYFEDNLFIKEQFRLNNKRLYDELYIHNLNHLNGGKIIEATTQTDIGIITQHKLILAPTALCEGFIKLDKDGNTVHVAVLTEEV